MRAPSCFALALSLSAGGRTRAETCGPPTAIAGADAALARADASVRLAFVTSAIEASSRDGKRWAWGWLGGYTALAAGQLALLPLVSRAQRIDYYVGAASTAAGFGSLALGVPAAIGEARRLRASLQANPGLDACARLALAERALTRSADDERANASWVMHALNFGYNAGVGLLLALAFDRYQTGALNAVAGTAIGELFIGTRPMHAAHALERYRRGDLGPTRPAPAAVSFYVAPEIRAGTIALRAGAQF